MSQEDFRILYTSSILAFSQWPIISLISSGWGSSHTCRQTLLLHRDHVTLLGNHYLEHIIRIDMTKSSVCWLEVVECLQQCRYVSNHTYSKYSPSMNSQIWNYEFMNIYNSFCVCVCKHDWLCIHPLRLSMTSTNNAINRQRQAWVGGLKPASCSINNILYLLYNNILYLLGP